MNRLNNNTYTWHCNTYIRSASGIWSVITNGIHTSLVTGGLKTLLERDYNLLIYKEHED